MNKNFKIIQINGFSGLLLVCFIITGLFCGFVLFPIWLLMTAWNAIIGDILNGVPINYVQATLLWGFITLSIYLSLKNSISFKVQKTANLNDEELKDLLKNNKNIDKTEDIVEENQKEEETIENK